MLKSGEKNILWTRNAVKNLQKVHRFYKRTASIRVADKILADIFRKTNDLRLGTGIGQEQESLRPLKQGHRYLVVGHIKILYCVFSEVVYVTHVFDTRQRPSKLK